MNFGDIRDLIDMLQSLQDTEGTLILDRNQARHLISYLRGIGVIIDSQDSAIKKYQALIPIEDI